MKPSKQPSMSNKLGGEVALARVGLAKAETQLKAAKEQARLAKRRRKEAKQAARRAKKLVKRAKTELAEAKQALADIEQKLALAAEQPNTPRRRAKARRTPKAPVAKPKPKKKTAPIRARRTVLRAPPGAVAAAKPAKPGKFKTRATTKPKVGAHVKSIAIPRDWEKPMVPSGSLRENAPDTPAIPPQPTVVTPEENTEQKPPDQPGTTPTIDEI